MLGEAHHKGCSTAEPRHFCQPWKNALKPQFAENDLDKVKFDKRRQAFYHDKSVKLLPQLEEGDAVRLKPFKLGQKKLAKG